MRPLDQLDVRGLAADLLVELEDTELLEQLQDVLDGLHRMQFNEARVMHFMRAMEYSRFDYGEVNLANLNDLGQEPYKAL